MVAARFRVGYDPGIRPGHRHPPDAEGRGRGAGARIDDRRQSLIVAGERDAASGRGDYSVTLPPKAPAGGTPDPGSAQAIAYAMVMDRGWDLAEYDCLVALWNRESHWNVYAENKTSGAYGIPQALPGTKMATVADDWRTNPETQIIWGLGYIAGRYQTPCGAWDHSERKGWY